MTDIIFIKALKIDTIIGVYDWEKKIKQTISLDLEMSADIKRAVQTDAIEMTLDYKAVTKRLIAFVRASEFRLVETLAENIAQIVITEFNVSWIRLTLNKGDAITGADGVGIIIEREKI